MYLDLTRVSEDMARSCIASVAVKNGAVMEVKGLAPSTLAKVGTVALDGECYELIANTDNADGMYALCSCSPHRYTNEQGYDFGDYDDKKAGETFRGYILSIGQVFAVEEEQVDDVASISVGDVLAPKATDTVWAKKAGTEKTPVAAKVLEKVTLHGKKMVKLVVVK